MAEQAFESVTHQNMLHAQGEEDARQVVTPRLSSRLSFCLAGMPIARQETVNNLRTQLRRTCDFMPRCLRQNAATRRLGCLVERKHAAFLQTGKLHPDIRNFVFTSPACLYVVLTATNTPGSRRSFTGISMSSTQGVSRRTSCTGLCITRVLICSHLEIERFQGPGHKLTKDQMKSEKKKEGGGRLRFDFQPELNHVR